MLFVFDQIPWCTSQFDKDCDLFQIFMKVKINHHPKILLTLYLIVTAILSKYNFCVIEENSKSIYIINFI